MQWSSCSPRVSDLGKNQFAVSKRRKILRHRCIAHGGQIWRLPAWCIVFVDEKSTNALAKIVPASHPIHHAEFHAHAVIETQVTALAQLAERHPEAGW